MVNCPGYHLKMHRVRSFINMGLHLALVACTVLALVPTIVRAQKALEPADPMWVALHEVCVAGGLVKVAFDDGGDPKTIGHEDCRYCQLGTSMDASPVSQGMRLAVSQRDTFPRLYWQAPQALHAWRTPAPRGPPSLV